MRISTIGNQRKHRDHPDYSMAEIGQNSEKSPGCVKRLAVAQISTKDQLPRVDVKKSQKLSSWNSHLRISTRTGGLRKTGRMETIQTIALLRSARILRRVQVT